MVNEIFKNSILLVNFNWSKDTNNYKLFKSFYGKNFKNIYFYSDIPNMNDMNDIIFLDTKSGFLAYRIFIHFYENFKDEIQNSDGVFYTHDDNILNLKLMNNFNIKNIIFNNHINENGYGYPTPIYTHKGWMWEYNKLLCYISPIVIQNRNNHDLMKDFISECPMYISVYEIINSIFDNIKLNGNKNDLLLIYKELYKNNIVKEKEIESAIK